MKPLNRMVLVEPLAEEESSKPAFYLPDDIVVNKKEFEVSGAACHLILENHVLGVVK